MHARRPRHRKTWTLRTRVTDALIGLARSWEVFAAYPVAA